MPNRLGVNFSGIYSRGKLTLAITHVFVCSDFSMQYGACKKAVNFLATVDCLLSLAGVAAMPGYVW